MQNFLKSFASAWVGVGTGHKEEGRGSLGYPLLRGRLTGPELLRWAVLGGRYTQKALSGLNFVTKSVYVELFWRKPPVPKKEVCVCGRGRPGSPRQV